MKKIEIKRNHVVRKHFYLSFILTLLLCFVMVSTSTEQIARAASAIVSLDTGENEVKKEENFSLLVSIDSAEEIGNVEMFVVFDSSKVSFVSGGKYTSSGDGIVLISDKNGSSANTRKKYTLEFKAKEEGKCKFYVGDEPTISLASGEELMSVSSISLEIEILAKKTNENKKEENKKENVENEKNKENSNTENNPKSEATNLKNIMLADGTLVPEFNKDITSYQVTLPNEITKLALSALPELDSSEVTIKGNDNLSIGQNKVTITVTAEDGTEKIYTITAIRQSAPFVAEQPKEELEFQNNLNNQNTQSNTPQIGVHCTETEDGTQITQYTKFTIIDLEDETKIPQGYMETGIRIDAHSITAYMPKDDMESETYLLYGKDENGNTNFYEYNRVDYTLKIYQPSYGGTTMKEKNEAVSANFQMMTAIIILGVLCAGLSVALVLQLLKEKQRKEFEQEEFFKNFRD